MFEHLRQVDRRIAHQGEPAMKIRTAIVCATAAIALTPCLAQAADSDLIRSCIDSFVATNFPNHPVSVVVNDTPSGLAPLAASTGTRTVQLVANDKTSGKVIGSATCTIKESADKAKKGTVAVGPLTT
jgi:hypothetical protein